MTTLVRDIMVHDVATVSPLATLREAMEIMRQRKVKSLVVDKQNEHDAFGIITYSTILRTIVAEEGDIDLINVYDVCDKPVITIASGIELKHVARLMVRRDIRRLVVTNGNELEGIVSMHDIVRSILEMLD